jgi:DNA-directed RNA polymerase subunit alpha
LDIGSIAVDSIFTPVLKVNYNVENTRVGQMTDYDRLTLQVWTNGVLSAREAVSLAGMELIEHFNFFADLADIKAGYTFIDRMTSPVVSGETALDDLDFSARAYNSLKRFGINSLNDLMKMTTEEISQIKNLGKKSFEEVINKLKSLGWNPEEEEQTEFSDDDFESKTRNNSQKSPNESDEDVEDISEEDFQEELGDSEDSGEEASDEE